MDRERSVRAWEAAEKVDRCAERSAAYHPPPYFNIDCPQSLSIVYL